MALFDREAPAAGDSGRSFSMVRRHYSNAVTARLAMAGTRTIANWEDEVGVADAGYVRCGYLLTVPERLEAACRDNVARLQELGLQTRFLGAGRDRRGRAGALDSTASPARRTSPRAASPTPRRCAWAGSPPPPRAASTTGSAARCAGCGSRAAASTGIETDRGFTAAGTVVLATGAWTNDLLRPLGAEQPIELRRLQVVVGRREPGRAAALGGVLRRRLERRRAPRPRPPLLRGRLRRRGSCSTAPTTATTPPRPGYADVVRRSVGERYPRLGEFAVERAFAGPYDITPDWNPIIGPCPGIEGLYLAVGWSGHGFKLSPAVGEVVAAEVTGRTPPIDVSTLRPERFAEGRLLRLAYGPGARA